MNNTNGIENEEDNVDIVETQPMEDIVSTQLASQDPDRLPEEHLWGYLLPCNPQVRRLDFLKGKLEYRVGRNKSLGNDFVLTGMKVSEYPLFGARLWRGVHTTRRTLNCVVQAIITARSSGTDGQTADL